jgi:histidine ammonia-lyase
MPVIDPTSPAYNEDSLTSWQAELQNNKILLYEVNKGIKAILTQGHQRYEINTGQSSQSVTRMSLEDLRQLRTELINMIDELEKALGVRSNTIQIVPGF